MRRLLVALAILFAAAGPAAAVLPDEMLADPVLEARARDLSAELRCLICQNQSIDDSNADVARDLRLLLRERLVAGDSDQEVLDYLVDRFGQYILLKPSFNALTAVLWAAPVVLLLVGIVMATVTLRRRQAAAAGVTDLSADEEQRLARLMKPEGGA